MSPGQVPAGLVIVSRAGCHLCDDMLSELAALESAGSIPPVTVLDVDSDPVLERQYGLKVPVLLLDGSAVCHYTLNSNELLRLLQRRPAILPR